MATSIVPVTYTDRRLWECKQCRNLLTADDTVAYHLVDSVLYGWCTQCFDGRRTVSLQHPSAAMDCLESGNARYARGDVAGAVTDYNKAIESNPRAALAYANRGLAQMVQGKHAAAKKDFVECLKLDVRLRPALESRIKQTERWLNSRQSTATQPRTEPRIA